MIPQYHLKPETPKRHKIIFETDEPKLIPIVDKAIKYIHQHPIERANEGIFLFVGKEVPSYCAYCHKEITRKKLLQSVDVAEAWDKFLSTIIDQANAGTRDLGKMRDGFVKAITDSEVVL